jgi:hypothetical protein
MPPKAAPRVPHPGGACSIQLISVAPHAYADVVQDGRCVECNHTVGAHAYRPADVPGVPADVRVGPSLAAPADPGWMFMRLLDAWKSREVAVADTSLWAKAFASMTAVMFDRSTVNVVNDAFTISGFGTARKFVFRTDIPEDTKPEIGLRLRRLADGAQSLLIILKIAARADYTIKKTHTHLMRCEYQLPVAVHVAETIMRKTPPDLPGTVIPWTDAETTDPMEPLWWGCQLASTPFESFTTVIPRLFEKVVVDWRGSHTADTIDATLWKTKYGAKTQPSTLGKRSPAAAAAVPTTREQGSGMSKSAKRRRARERREAGDGDADAHDADGAADGDGVTPVASADGGGDGNVPATVAGGGGRGFRGGGRGGGRWTGGRGGRGGRGRY